MNKKFKIKLFYIIFFIFLWEIINYLNIYPKALFPSFLEIIKKILDDLSNNDLLKSINYSLILLFKSISLSLIFSFILVFLSKVSKYFESLVELLILIFDPLPSIAIIPLVILWIGLGQRAIIFIIIHATLWPLVINMLNGLKNLNPRLIDIGDVFEFSLLDKIINIYFFGLLSDIISGLKIAWARGWRALISSEMVFGVLGSSSGLGWYIFERRVYMDTKGLYGGLIIVVIIGLIFEKYGFNTLKSLTVNKWRKNEKSID